MKFKVLYSFLVVIALAMAVEVIVEETETTLWENYKVSMYNLKLAYHALVRYVFVQAWWYFFLV